MKLTRSGVQQASNINLLETRNKRRNDGIGDIDPTAPLVSFLEGRFERRRENSIEVANSTMAKVDLRNRIAALLAPATYLIRV